MGGGSRENGGKDMCDTLITFGGHLGWKRGKWRERARVTM